ncbi:MAG: hypothetical protein GY866_33080, partial [Proteobacteria bacterium]|nr:hypothetical protein [Pseudomonadota bacterium]
MDRTIVVIAEHFGGEIKPVTWELLSCAEELRAYRSAEIKTVVLGDDVQGLAEKLSQKTGNDVVAVTVQDLVSYNAEVYKSVLEKLLPELNFAYVCVA